MENSDKLEEKQSVDGIRIKQADSILKKISVLFWPVLFVWGLVYKWCFPELVTIMTWQSNCKLSDSQPFGSLNRQIVGTG